MAKWSGLAKSVNAHLARWGKVNGEYERLLLATRALKGEDGVVQQGIHTANYPIMSAWGVFAQTWGLPQPDGTVITPLQVTEGGTINGRQQWEQNKATAQNGPLFMKRELEMLAHAETVYVSEEIVDRISYAADQMDPEPLFHTDMYAPTGLIILEKPLLVPDYHPRTGMMTDYLHVGMRALGWMPEPEIHRYLDEDETATRPGIMLFSYTTDGDWRDSYEEDLYRAVRQGKVDPAETGLMVNGELIPQGSFNYSMSHGLGRDMLSPTDVMPWSFGSEWTHKDKAIYEPGVVDSAVAYVRRWFLTLMRFTWQRLIVPDRPEFSKKLQRTVTEYRKPNMQWSVLRLRRSVERTEETGTGHKLAYRVQSRGHWRRVHVPTLGPARNEDGSFNDESHRLKWIMPYWRGPLDGPIGPMHKATVVVR